jgi:hypothetical protein
MPHSQWFRHVVGPHACHGISPKHDRWLYIQPQHTATMATVSFLQSYFSGLRDIAGVHKCQHGHFLKVVPEVDRLHINFSFSFVANPFRRVMSSAAIHGRRTHLAWPCCSILNNTRAHSASRPCLLMIWSLVTGALPPALPQTPTKEELARFNEWVLRFPFPISDAQLTSPWPQVAAPCPRTKLTRCLLSAGCPPNLVLPRGL